MYPNGCPFLYIPIVGYLRMGRVHWKTNSKFITHDIATWALFFRRGHHWDWHPICHETNPADGIWMYLVVPHSWIWCFHPYLDQWNPTAHLLAAWNQQRWNNAGIRVPCVPVPAPDMLYYFALFRLCGFRCFDVILMSVISSTASFLFLNYSWLQMMWWCDRSILNHFVW